MKNISQGTANDLNTSQSKLACLQHVLEDKNYFETNF